MESPAHQGSEAGRYRAHQPDLTSLAGPCATQRVAGFPRTLPPTPGPAGKRNLVTQSWGSCLLALTFLGALPLPIPGGRVPEGEFCGCRVRVPWAATRVPLAPSAPTILLSWKLHTGHPGLLPSRGRPGSKLPSTGTRVGCHTLFGGLRSEWKVLAIAQPLLLRPGCEYRQQAGARHLGAL